MAAFSISLKGVAAKAALGMGQRGQQTPAHSGSDKGDVGVRLAPASAGGKPRVGPSARGGMPVPRPVRRPVGSLGSGRGGGNPRQVKGVGARASQGHALGRGGPRSHLSGTTSVRVSSGIHGGGSRGGRGLLGVGGVNMGGGRARSVAGTLGRQPLTAGRGAGTRGLGGGLGRGLGREMGRSLGGGIGGPRPVTRKVGALGGHGRASGTKGVGLGRVSLGRKAGGGKRAGLGSARLQRGTALVHARVTLGKGAARPGSAGRKFQPVYRP
jgi:hypothetical protein